MERNSSTTVLNIYSHTCPSSAISSPSVRRSIASKWLKGIVLWQNTPDVLKAFNLSLVSVTQAVIPVKLCWNKSELRSFPFSIFKLLSHSISQTLSQTLTYAALFYAGPVRCRPRVYLGLIWVCGWNLPWMACWSIAGFPEHMHTFIY